jgi:hypothetical protein
MATTVNTPIQIPADSTSPVDGRGIGKVITTVAGVKTVTETLTLAKITPKGSTGSVTIKNGSVVSWTFPT